MGAQYIAYCYHERMFLSVCRAIERGGPGEVSVSRVKPEAAARRDRVRISGLARPLMPKPWGLPREAPGKAGEVEAVGAKLPRRCHAASWVPGVVGGGDRPGASIGWNCHQGQGVLARGSVVQAIAFAGIRSGRAAARATAPAPTGKPTVKPWARAACPSGQAVPDRSGVLHGGEWASSSRSNGRKAPGAIDAQ